MPLSDLWENLEVDESESGADWTITGGATAGDSGEIDWLAFMQDPSLPTLTEQGDWSSTEGTQTNPWTAGYSGIPFDPTTATGEDIATWIAEMGYSGSDADAVQEQIDWFVEEFSFMYDLQDWDTSLGYGTAATAAAEQYATLEAQMWESYDLWEEQNLETLTSTLTELSAGYTAGVEDIEQNRRDQLLDVLNQRKSAETATVASLTDLRRQSGRSGFGTRGLQSAFTSAQATLGGYTTSAATVNEMTEQALEDIDTQFSSSAESAYTSYANQQELELLEMEGDLELWQSQFEQEMENIYLDWGTAIQDQLVTDMTTTSEELFEGESGEVTFDPFGGTWTGPMWCSEPGYVWNAETGQCEVPNAGGGDGDDFHDPYGTGVECPEGYFASPHPPHDCVISGGGIGPTGTEDAFAPETIQCPPGQVSTPTGECVEGGSDIGN